MRLCLLLSFFVLAATYNVDCPANAPILSDAYLAGDNTTILMDVTDLMSKQDVLDLFDFVRNEMMPNIFYKGSSTFDDGNFFEGISFRTFGANNPSTTFTANYGSSCGQLSFVEQDAVQNGGKAMKLIDALKSINNNPNQYAMQFSVVFSKTQDRNEILEAAEYVRCHLNGISTMHVTIAILGANPAVWQGLYTAFPFVVPAESFANNKLLGRCLATCADVLCSAPPCDPSIFPDGSSQPSYSTLTCPTPSPPSSRIPTTSTTTTTSKPTSITVTTKAQSTSSLRQSSTSSRPPTTTTDKASLTKTSTRVPPTTPQSQTSADDGPSCSCNLQKLWIDVVVLIDNSADAGKDGTDDLLDYLQDIFEDINIQKSSSSDQSFTMLGIVIYNSLPTLLYPLGSLDSSSFQAISQLPYSNINATNIDSALQIAQDQLSSTGRPNTRKVIMILGTGYQYGNYPVPQNRSTIFKSSGGIITVYDYLDKNRVPSEMLISISSHGYYIKNTDVPDSLNMSQSVCNANCFCNNGFAPFTTDELAGFPTAGCYKRVENRINYQLASNNCQKQFGYVAMEKNPMKAQFLSSLLLVTDRYWAGFTWDNIWGDWIWNDKTKVNGTYQPWLTSPAHTSGIDCAYVQQVGGAEAWQQDNCRSSYTFICERPACDSNNYCSEPFPS